MPPLPAVPVVGVKGKTQVSKRAVDRKRIREREGGGEMGGKGVTCQWDGWVWKSIDQTIVWIWTYGFVRNMKLLLKINMKSKHANLHAMVSSTVQFRIDLRPNRCTVLWVKSSVWIKLQFALPQYFHHFLCLNLCKLDFSDPPVTTEVASNCRLNIRVCVVDMTDPRGVFWEGPFGGCCRRQTWAASGNLSYHLFSSKSLRGSYRCNIMDPFLKALWRTLVNKVCKNHTNVLLTSMTPCWGFSFYFSLCFCCQHQTH